MPSIDLRTLLHSGKLNEAEQFVLDAGREYVEREGLDLIAVVADVLKENSTDDAIADSCKTILTRITEMGVPKECLVGILEQIPSTDDENVFVILLKPLELCLTKLPSQRGKTLRWTLDTLQTYISRLPLPKSCKYEGEERLLLDLDPDVQKTTRVIRHYLNFLKPFVEEVSLSPTVKKISFVERMSYQRDILCHHLLLVLDYPLSYLDLSHDSNTSESLSRSCAMKVMTYLRKMKGNSLDLYEFVHDYSRYDHDKDLGDQEVSILAASTLAYLTVKEGLGNIPCVYVPTYLLEIHLEFCTILLSHNEDLVQLKGLLLLESTLAYAESSSLQKDILEIPQMSKLQQCLIAIMVYNSVNEYRQLALRLFKSFIEKLTMSAKYFVLLNLLSCERHSGVRGLLISLYKNCLHTALASDGENPFLGHNLHIFLSFATKLPEKVETDLLKESDCIFATLNFLRYLVICDPQELNATGIWNMVEDLKTTYLETLRTGLNLSRAHYEHRTKDELNNKSKSTSTETVLQVGDEKLPNLPAGHHANVLQSALLTFDLLESVIVRLEESL